MAVPFVNSDDWDPEVALANARRDFGEVKRIEFASRRRRSIASRDRFCFCFCLHLHLSLTSPPHSHSTNSHHQPDSTEASTSPSRRRRRSQVRGSGGFCCWSSREREEKRMSIHHCQKKTLHDERKKKNPRADPRLATTKGALFRCESVADLFNTAFHWLECKVSPEKEPLSFFACGVENQTQQFHRLQLLPSNDEDEDEDELFRKKKEKNSTSSLSAPSTRPRAPSAASSRPWKAPRPRTQRHRGCRRSPRRCCRCATPGTRSYRATLSTGAPSR